MVRRRKSRDVEEVEYTCNCNCRSSTGGCGGIGYFLGFLGAAIYYISIAPNFWAGVLGVLKALVWPLFLVYELFKYLAI